jgi:circadian clock protein KaiC
MVMLGYVDMGSDLRRLVSVLKVGGATHDKTLREFVIGADGVELTGAFESAEAVLRGVPRVASHAARSATSAVIAQSGEGLGGS